MKRTLRVGRSALLAGAVIVATVLGGCTPAPPPPVGAPARDAIDYAAAAASARDLRVIDPSEDIPRYSRATFGEPWMDVDGNGCSQRQDVLGRDLVDTVVAADGCTILRGTLAPDPYTGSVLAFEHDRIAADGAAGSRAVQIDHIVSLSAAHAGGAWRWSRAERTAFANDLSHLRAVDGGANEAKGNLGPARWLPTNPDTVCAYLADYARITTAWHLAVRGDDRDVLVARLESCR